MMTIDGAGFIIRASCAQRPLALARPAATHWP
jgi:hypothetical protein